MHFQKWFWCGVLFITKYFKNWNKFAFFFTLKMAQINDHGGNISDSGLGWQYCQWHCLQNLFCNVIGNVDIKESATLPRFFFKFEPAKSIFPLKIL